MAPALTIDRLLTEDIFSLVGMQGLSDDEKNILFEQMQQTVLARVYAGILAALPPEQQAALDALAPDQVQQYVADLGVSLTDLIAEESVRYRIELAQAFEQVASAASASTVATPTNA